MPPVAFITGASSGLGRGMALRLAAEGYDVGVGARRSERLAEVVEEISRRGRRAAAYPCDVGVKDEVQGALRSCRSELGPVDLLILSAGVSEMTEVAKLSSDDIERIMRVNFLGAVYAVEAVLPEMLARHSGQLVAVGSLAGYGGLPLTAAYSASKGALHNFFESLRLDLRRTGVGVTFITPGYVRTPMTAKNDHWMPFLVECDDAVERIVRAIRKRRRLLTFPAPLAFLVWIGQIFPSVLYDFLVGSQRRTKIEPQDAGPAAGEGQPEV